MDAVFHMAALRITACAAEPREALEVMCDGTLQRARSRAASRREEGRRPPRRPRSTAWPTAFPTDEDHHPYNNRTWYGAQQVMLEGLLRSFNDMYGLPYVALRYFNVYGPRMDMHGKYTEVLIRWMERIAAGQPPLILGDGKQTMDFVYVDDIARANVLALQSDVTDDVFNVASGVETSLNDLADALLRVMGSNLHAGIRPGAQGQSGARAGWPTRPRPQSMLGFRADVASTRACAGWSTGGAPTSATSCLHDPDHANPLMDEREADAAAPRHPLRLDHAGPGGRGVRAGVRRVRRRAARLRRVELHDRAAPGAARGRRRAGRRGHHGQPLVHRHRQRHPLLRRHAGVRRHRPAHLQHRPGRDRGGDHAATRAPSCACTRWACPATWRRIVAIGARARPAGDRGRRLRHRQRDPMATANGSGSAGRTATSPASRSTRARS